MFCTHCGVQLEESQKFCSQCGTEAGGSASAPKPSPRSEKLYRSLTDRKLAGVCAGFAQYLGVDVTVCRLATVGVTLVTGVAPGVLTYLFAWIIMPVDSNRPPVSQAYDPGAIPARS